MLRSVIFYGAFILNSLNCYCQVSDTAVYGTIQVERFSRYTIKNAEVEVFAPKGSFKVSVDSAGRYYIKKALLKGERMFSMSATADGFLNKTVAILSKDSCCNYPIQKNFILNPSCGLGSRNYIYFEENKWNLGEKNNKYLNDLTDLMTSDSLRVIKVLGRADFREKNPTKLSFKRADAIRNYLISKGIAEQRIMTTACNDTSYIFISMSNNFGYFEDGIWLNKEYVSKLTDPDQIEQSKILNRVSWFESVEK